MKIVLDTNVLIAALISPGRCADLVEHCVSVHTIVTSQFVLDELRGHLLGKFGYTTEEAEEAIALLGPQMQIVVPERLDQPVCRDADDDVILGTAKAGQAECIVTGDKDLLVIQRYEGIEIVTPGGFLDFETRFSKPDA
jgi:putative PIN family toxin of toxin-antitoxin system